MITELDFLILNFIRSNLTGDIADVIMKFITRLGDAGALWIVIAVVLLCFRKTRNVGICLAIALVITHISGTVILKNIFARTRPFIEANVPIIINPPSGYSFPSGHTSSSFAAATVLSGFYKKYAAVFYAVATLIAISRVYLYVHYPSDILGGAVLGIAVGIICIKLKNGTVRNEHF
ncbi:MAG: phosphatase PAP2 family protein [Clostridia bacterium]|nr:phosphatase PAP2 family protein [Clostridia bacterium]